MKIDLTSAVVKNQVTAVRKQIKNSQDLKNFDEFLVGQKVIDFQDEVTAAKARRCCSGDHCCENITIEFSVT